MQKRRKINKKIKTKIALNLFKFDMTLLKNLILVVVFTLVIGDEHTHIVSKQQKKLFSFSLFLTV